MKKMVRTGLLLIVIGMGASACTSLLGGFDFDGVGGSTSSSTSSSGTGGSAPECSAPTDCPAPSSVCVKNTCNDGKCGTAPVAAGAPTATQTAGDCKSQQCDSSGKPVDVNDDTDKPDDKKACTDDVCTAGVPSNPASTAGTACGTDLTCDGNGDCTGCVTATQCPGTNNDCLFRTCTLGVCGVSNTAAGTVTTAQSAGDCKEAQCDGTGAIVSVAKNTDLPVDSNQCTSDVCTAGVPSNPNIAAGTACTMGGAVCSGSGSCVECVTGTGCASGICTNNVCATPSCTDLIKNGNETDVDCGGACLSTCFTGKVCKVNADCVSMMCHVTKICQ